MSIRIGIISALEREVAPFISGWGKRKLSRAPFVAWTDPAGETTYVASGIGREPGLAAAEALVAECRPDVLISAGFAGALVPERRVGEEITPGVVVDAVTSESFRAESGSSSRIVSSGLIANRNAKLELNSRFQAEAVDMEGAAVATIARRHHLPFYVVKTISDELDFPMLPFGRFVDDSGHLDVPGFIAYISVRPKFWSALITMGRNSRRAAAKLDWALQHLITGIRQSKAISVN